MKLVGSRVRPRQNFQAHALGDFDDRVSSVARTWGQKIVFEAMHVCMGENTFSLWSYHFGSAYKSIQLPFDICKVSNHHLVHDIQQILGRLHHLHRFQWTITPCHSYVEYWPLGGLNVTSGQLFQYVPAVSLRILQFPSNCNNNVPYCLEGASASCTQHLPRAIYCNGCLRVSFKVLLGCMFTGSDQRCFLSMDVLLK